MKFLLAHLNANPKFVAWLGAISGWASFDFLRAAQIVAAVLAGLVSLCALILTGPQALAKLRSWLRGIAR